MRSPLPSDLRVTSELISPEVHMLTVRNSIQLSPEVLLSTGSGAPGPPPMSAQSPCWESKSVMWNGALEDTVRVL